MKPSAPRIVVLDRDGVINEDEPGHYVCSAEEWVPIEGSLEAMAALAQDGYAVYVVSNQSGIGRGLFSEAELGRMHAKLLHGLAELGGRLSGWYYCPHTPQAQCRCRKPAPGLLESVAKAAGCSLAGVAFIGDKWTDLLAGKAMEMRTMLVATGHGDATVHAHGGEVNEYFENLAAAADALLTGRPG